MLRDRDVRRDIQDRLVATNAFDSGGVALSGLPADYGQGTSIASAASINPKSGTQDDRWDGGDDTGSVITSVVEITLYQRNEDPQERDEGAELLLNTLRNAINGQSLAGITAPDLTRVPSWRWVDPTAPERQIVATITYQYLLDGWTNSDVTP